MGLACASVVKRLLAYRSHSASHIAQHSDPNCQVSLVITEVKGSGCEYKTYMTIRGPGESDPRLTLKEQALLPHAVGDGAATNFLVSYVSPDAVDGLPVSSDAFLQHIPQPLFWSGEWAHNEGRFTFDCNALVRVDLDASGVVTDVERVPPLADNCNYTADVLDAARKITFYPALRDGIPVSQRISIMYRLH